jgi:hypothetical protein
MADVGLILDLFCGLPAVAFVCVNDEFCSAISSPSAVP